MADTAIEDFEEEFVVLRRGAGEAHRSQNCGTRGEDAVALSWNRHSEVLAAAKLDSEERLDCAMDVIYELHYSLYVA